MKIYLKQVKAMKNDTLRKNPSRKTCEDTIKRILTAEINETGHNTHFKNASDFMSYFESLYPASDGLKRQVQRALKSLDLPRDDSGYFIINKTKGQYSKEQELLCALSLGCARISSIEKVQVLFIELKPALIQYVISLISENESLNESCITIVPSCNGIIVYTKDADAFKALLKEFWIG